jgi:5-(carboxyamino)imidazole ribonucleotide mutase
MIPLFLGSDADKEFASKITKVLDEFQLQYKVIACSAHKAPERLLSLIQKYDALKEPVVYITIAGRSNGLSGVTAGNTINPVIACPPFSDKADYLVNIHSTIQMPSDTPTLTVIDPVNAALCAARILALNDSELRKKLDERMKKVKASFIDE